MYPGPKSVPEQTHAKSESLLLSRAQTHRKQISVRCQDTPTTTVTSATMYDSDHHIPPDSASIGYDPHYVPDPVKSFVVATSFQSISEKFFKDAPWPSVDAVASYVDNDHVFCLLYREMWFRHLYVRLSPTPTLRIDSWNNYCNLFQVVLHGVVNMQLPNQWLWDMVDEFVYEFQSFCLYRAKMKNKTELEIALLQKYDQAWNVYGVLNFLQALVEKSMITQNSGTGEGRP